MEELVETWKPITDYEELYQISNLGNVKSLKRGKNLKSWICKGYKQVRLCKDGVCKTYYIHRLVALTFLINPLNLKQVNHIDGIRNNNTEKNLEWCSCLDNIIHSYKVLKTKLGENHPRATLKEQEVLKILDLLEKKTSQTEIAKIFNVSKYVIFDIKRGKSWSYLKEMNNGND